MKTLTKTQVYRDQARKQGTYDIYIEIDTDCEELVDAVGLDYTRTEDDDTQNEICISLTESEFNDVFDQSILSLTNEQTIGSALLNLELSEYVTKVTAYKPSGDIISFY